MPFRRATPWLAALLLASGPCPAPAGEMYRWTDANGRSHFSDQPRGAGAERVEPDAGRMSVIDTVVVKDNAMREVVDKEIRRQQQGRQAKVEAAERAEAKAERDKARRCEALRKRIARAEGRVGSLLSGELDRLDEENWNNCR